MFTGLIEGKGVVVSLEDETAGVRVVVEAPVEICTDDPRDARRVGDSVAIDGCCLTAVAVEGRRWSFQAGPETLAKTTLGRRVVGNAVNLERPLPAGGRLGGHFVQGHVDGVGVVAAIERDVEWVTMWFTLNDELASQLVPKGSVAVDGVSLTVVDVEVERFSVALIPHTLDATTLGDRDVGDAVNIETDILGKYVQRFLRP